MSAVRHEEKIHEELLESYMCFFFSFDSKIKGAKSWEKNPKATQPWIRLKDSAQVTQDCQLGLSGSMQRLFVFLPSLKLQNKKR